MENLAALLKELKHHKATLVAVSKEQRIQEIERVYKSGVTNFGENYIGEALDKIEKLKNLNLNWHYIGRVQSGNLKKLANRFQLIHSLFKLKHVEKLNNLTNKTQDILIQISHKEDVRKNGVTEEELFTLVDKLSTLKKIKLRGLMFMPPENFEEKQLIESFKWAEGLYKKLKEQSSNIDTLSMGMSRDYKLALANGSTHVRLGTVIFGKRRN